MLTQKWAFVKDVYYLQLHLTVSEKVMAKDPICKTVRYTKRCLLTMHNI